MAARATESRVGASNDAKAVDLSPMPIIEVALNLSPLELLMYSSPQYLRRYWVEVCSDWDR